MRKPSLLFPTEHSTDLGPRRGGAERTGPEVLFSALACQRASKEYRNQPINGVSLFPFRPRWSFVRLKDKVCYWKTDLRPYIPTEHRKPGDGRLILWAGMAACVTPKMRVLRAADSLGFAFEPQRRDMPGRPDLIFASLNAAVFVHRCFPHGHGCHHGRTPRALTDWWSAERARKRSQDRKAIRTLRWAGWRVLVIWECQTTDAEWLAVRLRRFLQKSDR